MNSFIGKKNLTINTLSIHTYIKNTYTYGSFTKLIHHAKPIVYSSGNGLFSWHLEFIDKNTVLIHVHIKKNFIISLKNMSYLLPLVYR